MKRVLHALDKVEALLTGSTKKKPSMQKATGLKPAKARKPAKKVKAETAQPITATAETWEQAHKIVALYAPNLKKLKKFIAKGRMSVDEVVAAVVEALKTKHVSMHLAGVLAEVLKDALVGDAGDVYDMPAAEGSEPSQDEKDAKEKAA